MRGREKAETDSYIISIKMIHSQYEHPTIKKKKIIDSLVNL